MMKTKKKKHTMIVFHSIRIYISQNSQCGHDHRAMNKRFQYRFSQTLPLASRPLYRINEQEDHCKRRWPSCSNIIVPSSNKPLDVLRLSPEHRKKESPNPLPIFGINSTLRSNPHMQTSTYHQHIQLVHQFKQFMHRRSIYMSYIHT